MISVTIENKKKEEQNANKYPYIGVYTYVHRNTKKYVWFTAKNSGILLHVENPTIAFQYDDAVGEYDNKWLEKDFARFEGKLILENKE